MSSGDNYLDTRRRGDVGTMKLLKSHIKMWSLEPNSIL